jgi:DNA-binding beta-propeller fold protein YncE
MKSLFKNYFPVFLFLIPVFIFADSAASEKNITPVKLWETQKVLSVPESVLHNQKDNILYISNIDGKPLEKDGKGFISKISTDGEILQLQWAKGLNAPKGAAIFKDSFYVTDIDRLVEIDMNSGKIKNTYPAKGAVFLNDAAADLQGNIYVTDMSEKNSVIYRLSKTEFSIWYKGPEIKTPNGIHFQNNMLAVGNSGDKTIKFIKISDKSIVKSVPAPTKIDGLRPFSKNSWIISDWAGKTSIVYESGNHQLLIDTSGQKINSADLEYIQEQNLLIIPTFFNNTIAAYKLP